MIKEFQIPYEDYIDYHVPGEIYLNGYYFRDCELYINFL